MLEVSTNSMCFDTVASTSQSSKNEMAKSDMTQVVALAVISRLHDWCVQLFWITVFCVLGVCGDEESRTSIYQLHEKQQQQESLTRKRTSIAEIEKKLLRHITSPFLSNLRPVSKSTKKRPASRPPSPQLFDIEEESED
uniref:Protein E01G4.3, isoform a n=1 Tax=Haemonchus contortus TaxID=6289 RepID=A0A7I4Y0A9_HAECO